MKLIFIASFLLLLVFVPVVSHRRQRARRWCGARLIDHWRTVCFASRSGHSYLYQRLRQRRPHLGRRQRRSSGFNQEAFPQLSLKDLLRIGNDLNRPRLRHRRRRNTITKMCCFRACTDHLIRKHYC